VYSDAGDVIYADRKFLGIYSPKGGRRTIRLPRPSRVVDLMDGQVLSTRGTEFELDMPENTARLLATE
jgi:hypothetical protein